MEFTVLSEKIKRGISIMERVINPRSTLPILGSILVKADKEGIILEATDLEMGVRYRTTGSINKEGALAVPARVLGGFITNVNEEKITLKAEDGILTLETNSTKAKINGASADEFPLIPEVSGKKIITTPSAPLREKLTKVTFAAATNESRPVLTGVFFSSTPEGLKLAATDSFRLAEESTDIKTSEEFKVIIPVKTLSELLRIMEGENEVSVTLGENQVLFKVGEVILVSRLIEGEYPDYQQIIPKEAKTKARINVSEFNQLIKTALVFAKESANNIKLTFNKEGIEISSASSELGEFKSLMKARVEGEDNEINFNGRYLLDGLAVLGTTEADLVVNEKLSPALLTPKDKKDFRYVVMPLRS